MSEGKGARVWVILALAALVWAAAAQDFDGDEDFGMDMDMGMDPYGGGYGGYDPYGYGYGDEAEPPAAEPSRLESVETVTDFLKAGTTEATVVGFFGVTEPDSQDLDVFKHVATKVGPIARFGYSTSVDVLEHFKYDGTAVLVYKPTLMVNEKYEKPRARYPNKRLSEESLQKFITTKSLPLVGYLLDSTEDLYASAALPVLILFAEVDIEKNPKGLTYFANRLRKVATEFADRMLFSIARKATHPHLFHLYGVEFANKEDVGVGIRHGEMYYRMEGSFSVEGIRSFVNDFMAGNLVGKLNDKDYSAPDDLEDHEDGEDGPVVKLTDSNFDEVVTSSSNDVMVEFFAPWCGHCKSLNPVYKKVAERLNDISTVTIAAMDATANTVPSGFEVSGYPTLVFVPANKKSSPIPYDGPREENAIIDFIRKNSHHTVDEL